MASVTIRAARPTVRTAIALMRAGFRRYATYRQATIAATVTNSVFGFLRCFVLLAVVAEHPRRLPAGYTAEQLALYTWASQGLIGVVALWGWTDLGDRIRTGDVVSDLLRPMHPVLSYLYTDLGRAGHAALTRFVVPVVVGAVFFDLHVPTRPETYPLFGLSVLLAVVVCFAARYLVNAAGFWLLASSLTYGGRDFTSFPVTVYDRAFRYLFAYGFGFAFVSYYPALALLGRDDPLGAPSWVAWWSPAAAVPAVLLASVIWRFGVRRYRSTGS